MAIWPKNGVWLCKNAAYHCRIFKKVFSLMFLLFFRSLLGISSIFVWRNNTVRPLFF